MTFFVGCDVGSSSVRAGLIDEHGKILNHVTKSISIKHHCQNRYEQSSKEIWSNLCYVIKQVCKGIPKEEVAGIGFCATCSLVLLDTSQKPCPIDESSPDHNIIMWMDHRAEEEANEINTTNYRVLDFVGGKISLEMQIPKIMWLKKHRPSLFNTKLGYLFDLPDFLTFKATGSFSRSSCSVTCKWTYTHEKGWSKDFFEKNGLGKLCENDFEMIGSDIKTLGQTIGSGLTKQAAEEMSLLENTPVSTSLIDAHCGGIGVLGCDTTKVGIPNTDLVNRLAIISGTSSCHMSVTREPMFIKGVWGPYYSAMVPNYWLNEGGQSATGKLIDFIVKSHPAYQNAVQEANHLNAGNVHEFLNQFLKKKALEMKLNFCDFLTKDLHVYPDFHGNRSPIADSSLRGMFSGLKLDDSLNDLSLKYLATIQSVALQCRHIVLRMREHKSKDFPEQVFMCGGLSKNKLFMQVHANVLRVPVILSTEEEAVTVGAGILGAVGAKKFESSVEKAMKNMSHAKEVVLPEGPTEKYYDKKYNVYNLMLNNQIEYSKIMMSF